MQITLPILSDKFNDLQDYVMNKLHPWVHDNEDEIQALKAHQESTTGRVADLRDQVTNLRGIVIGNGHTGLQEQINGNSREIADVRDDMNYLKKEREEKVASLQKYEIDPLKEWKNSINNKFWTILLLIIGLVLEKIWELMTVGVMKP